ncbi:MAG: hypothetical protein ACRDYA_09895 [Egibacteraceae bacterium]
MSTITLGIDVACRAAHFGILTQASGLDPPLREHRRHLRSSRSGVQEPVVEEQSARHDPRHLMREHICHLQDHGSLQLAVRNSGER